MADGGAAREEGVGRREDLRFLVVLGSADTLVTRQGRVCVTLLLGMLYSIGEAPRLACVWRVLGRLLEHHFFLLGMCGASSGAG